MKQNISCQRKQKAYNYKPHNHKLQSAGNHISSNQLEITSEISSHRKQLFEYSQIIKQNQLSILSLQKQLKQIELQQGKIQTQTLKTELEYQSVKLDNLQKRHQYEEQKEQQEQGQNQMHMNAWLDEVQKYNGLSQQAIDSLFAMEYEGNPLETDICLSCYKEMLTGDMSKYLPCAHLFHRKCIDQHLKINKVCPACMEEVII